MSTFQAADIQDAMRIDWDVAIVVLRREFPEIAAHSSSTFQSFESIAPERWIRHRYACVRIDARGSGRSRGVIDVAAQPSSNGKVGMAGMSHHALNQWQVAALRPPHLAALVPMEGVADPYRELIRHGGILCRQLRRSRVDFWSEIQRRVLDDVVHRPIGVLQRCDAPPLVRHANEFPLAETSWTPNYLAAQHSLQLQAEADGRTTYRGLSEGVTFLTDTFTTDTEITGPLAAKLQVSSSTADADIVISLDVINPHGRTVEFREPGSEAFLNVWGGERPVPPLPQGWLRASRRKLDTVRSLPYRPFHIDDELQPLGPRAAHELDVEIWPTSVILPAGSRLALHVSGKDWGLHGEPKDRPESVFDNSHRPEQTISTAAAHHPGKLSAGPGGSNHARN